MSKLDYDILVLEKLNKVITEQLPKFASGYFKAKKNQMALKSLYGYSLDISGFFKYMEVTNDISPKDFTLKDLDKISESDIENFMKSIENVEAYGEVRKRSVQALRRSFFALNSFFTFFYKEDLISTLPTFKVAPPAPVNKPSAMTTASDSLKLLDFVANGTLSIKRILRNINNFINDIGVSGYYFYRRMTLRIDDNKAYIFKSNLLGIISIR